MVNIKKTEKTFVLAAKVFSDINEISKKCRIIMNQIVLAERGKIMIKVAICDDDQAIHQQLIQWFQQFPLADNQFDITSFYSGEQLLACDCHSWELIILDMHMEKLNGIQTARQLRQHNDQAVIVFLTGFNYYLVEGYEVEAFRYILKPIEQEQFNQVLHKVLEKLQLIQINATISYKDQRHIIPIRHISSVEIVRRKVVISTIEQQYTDDHPFNYWEALLLPYDFIEIYNKVLVNKNHIIFYDHTQVRLSNGQIQPISRRKLEHFKQQMLR